MLLISQPCIALLPEINNHLKDVFLKGLAEDGGLFVPKSIKPFKKEELDNFKNA